MTVRVDRVPVKLLGSKAPPSVRLPLDPIIRLATAQAQARGDEFSAKAICRSVGLDDAQWHRWQRAGTLSVEHADLVAQKALDLHPALIWPEWYDLPFVVAKRPRKRA